MKILILEDNLDRKILFHRWLSSHDLTFTDSANTCIKVLASQTWNVLFLDHDLGGEEMAESGPGTGYEVAKWLADNPDRIPGQVILHSLNPIGRQNMYNVLSRVFPGVEEAPGCWMHR